VIPPFLADLPIVGYAPLGTTRLTGGHARLDERGAYLAICRHEDDGFYLFGCDAAWNVVSDTWHETAADAIEQAQADTGVAPGEWTWMEDGGG
jgi:hypothetical protein